MIRCPNCGTINRDGRRSCRKCGNALPQTKLRCPECGALNPVGNLFCDQCNARLISPEDVVPSEAESGKASDAAPVKGISLPTRSVEDDEEEDATLPDWLLELADDDTVIPATQVQPEPEQSGAEEDAGYPDWASGLVDEDAFDDEPTEEEPESDAFALEGGDLPDWLRDIEEPTEEPQAGSEAFSLNDEDLPDWLRDTGETADSTAPSYEETVEESEAEGPSLDDEDLPDWLRDVEAAEPEGAPSIEDAAATDAEAAPADWDIPDWLAEHADPSLMEGQEATGQALPDWLAERAEEIPTSSTSFDQSLPDWLQPAAELPAPEPEEEDISPTLEEAGGEFELPEAEPVSGFETEGLPDWLSEEFEEIEPEAEPAQPETELAEADLPDWLRGVDEDFEADLSGEPQRQESESGEAWPPAQPEPQIEPPTASDESVVAPLAEDEEEEPLPDWLADIEVTNEVDIEAATDVFAEELEESTPAEEPEVAIPDEAPEWLRDIAPPERPPEVQSGPPAFVGAEESDEETEGEEPEMAAPEEIPDWLKDLEPSSGEQSEPSAPSTAEEEPRPAMANLPAWMQGLRPPEGTGTAEEMQPFTEAAEAEGLVPAEIPDWVRALRPELEAGRAETPRAERIQKAASMEMEGPLSSLRGVLTETTIVDLPTDMDVSLTTVIPEDVREQAELWQGLLSRPRSVRRSVAQAKQRRRQGAVWVRMLLTAILFLGVLTGLWFMTPTMRISQTPSPQSAPGIGLFQSQLEQLRAGQTVLVAVEYGPAYADEMNAMAEALFEHLKDRQVNLKLVSTLPEGTGLSQAALMEVYGNHDAVLQRTYLVNQLPGVAGYLQSADAQEARHLVVLASRPDRVRWWVEQNAALQGIDGASPFPVSVAASASVGPLITPYLEESMVEGWLIGLPQTLTYRELRGFDNAAYGGIPDVLMFAHWIVAAFLLFGMLYHLARGRKGAG